MVENPEQRCAEIRKDAVVSPGAQVGARITRFLSDLLMTRGRYRDTIQPTPEDDSTLSMRLASLSAIEVP